MPKSCGSDMAGVVLRAEDAKRQRRREAEDCFLCRDLWAYLGYQGAVGYQNKPRVEKQ